MEPSSGTEPVRVALIGSGRMGAFHAETLRRRLPGAQLVAIADPAPGAAARLVGALGAARACTDAAQVLADPEVDAVVIAAPARFHADLAVAAAGAGKGVFCEKPMAMGLPDADRVIAAAHSSGVVLQVGFNRRFAEDWREARALLEAGLLGTPRLLRSLTRDPGGFDPAGVAPDTIFLETLIHDFDTLAFLNPGSRAVEVFASADALIEPGWRDRGLLDTAVVQVRFDNGAISTAEACFEAAYGYDVRGELLASAGMVALGDGRRSGLTFSGPGGRSVDLVRSDQELFADAYTAELAAFVQAVRTGTPAPVTGQDARAALEIALAAARSVRTGRPVLIADLDGQPAAPIGRDPAVAAGAVR